MKKIISGILVISVVFSMIVFADAKDDKLTPNKNILESLINGRGWVLDIIVDGNYSTNPYIKGVANFEEYSDAAYQRFINNGFNKALVRLVDILYNSTDYLSDGIRKLTTDEIEAIRGYYGIVIPNEKEQDMEYLVNVIENSLHSVFGETREEKYYDYIFNGIFTTKYTSHSQMSLEEEEINLSEIQTLLDNYDLIKEIADSAGDLAGLGTDLANQIKAAKADKMFDFYSESVYHYLHDYTNVYKDDFDDMGIYEDITEEKLSLTDALYNLTMCQRATHTEDGVEKWKKDIQGDKLLSKTNKVLSTIGATVSFVNSAIDNYILIESLQQQKGTTLGALQTLYDNSNNKRLKSSVAEYINLLSKEFDELTFLYKTGLDTLSSSDLVYDAVSDFVTKKVSGLILRHASLSTAKIASKVASVGAAAKITTFLGDKVTGVEETAKKVYQIEHTLKIIDGMVDAYKKDLSFYNSNKTDENAKKVLDDLLLLKKMRLFASKLTYDSAVNQLNTPLGWLMCGGENLASNWDNIYQEQVDMLLSATLSPMGKLPFEVKSGEKLYIYTAENYAMYQKNGRYYTIGEASERFMSGINLSGGELYFVGGASNGTDFYVSNIASTGNSYIKVMNNINLELYGFSQEQGKMTLELAGNIIINKNGDFSSSDIEFVGDGRMLVKGNLNGSQSTIPNVVFCGNKRQYINGSGFTVNNLAFRNTSVEGVNITGKVNVTGILENTYSTITGGKNIFLGQYGDVAGNYYKGNVTLDRYSYNRNIVFDGSVYVNGSLDINAPAPVIKGSLISDGAATVNLSADSSLKIMGDMGFIDSTVNCGNSFEVEGDIYLTNSDINADKIILTGKSAQKIKADEPVTVKELINRNTSRKGVEVEGTWNITETIEASEGKFISGENIVLKSETQITGAILNSSVTTDGWTCNDSFALDGTMYVKGDTTFNSGSNVEVSQAIRQTDGKLTVNENAQLCAKSDYIATSGSVLTDGLLESGSDIILSDISVGGKGEISTKGDFSANNITGIFNTIKLSSLLPQNFIFGESTEVQNFILENYSLGGITMESEVIVYNDFVNKTSKITNGEKIICRTIIDDSEDVKVVKGNLSVDEYECETNLHIRGNLIVNRSLIIPENKTVFVDGNLIAQADSSILIGKGAKLEIMNDLNSSGGSIMLGEEAQIIVKENALTAASITTGENSVIDIGIRWISSGGEILINGTAFVGEDVSFGTSDVRGNGLLVLSGDLCGGNGITGISLKLESKVPQFLANGNYTFNNISVENSSSLGVTPEGNVYYTGILDVGNSNISRPEKFLSKQEG